MMLRNKASKPPSYLKDGEGLLSTYKICSEGDYLIALIETSGEESLVFYATCPSGCMR